MQYLIQLIKLRSYIKKLKLQLVSIQLIKAARS